MSAVPKCKIGRLPKAVQEKVNHRPGNRPMGVSSLISPSLRVLLGQFAFSARAPRQGQ